VKLGAGTRIDCPEKRSQLGLNPLVANYMSWLQGHISSDISQITERFEVKRELDRGTFGAVFKAYDTKHR